MLSVAYLALVQESPAAGDDANWEDCYHYLPWEDWRCGPPGVLGAIRAALDDWLSQDAASQVSNELRERIDICFGFGESAWDAYRVLQRYEILYEAQLVDEYWLDRGRTPADALASQLGTAMAFDHRRILATGLSRVRGKLQYRPVAFELIADKFTLFDLQNAVDAISGLQSHKQNFRAWWSAAAWSSAPARSGRRPAGGRPSCSGFGGRYSEKGARRG